jgi:radical SAM superfamily enzyme YgiQ (UPF0313 family)
MKALIIVPRYANRPVDYYNLPMGMLYLATAIRKQADVSILNLNEILQQDVEHIIKRRVKNVDIVFTGGLSVHFMQIKDILRMVRTYSKAKIVVGGGLVTSQPEIMSGLLKNVDVFIYGESDQLDIPNNCHFSQILIMNTVHKDILDITFPAYDLFNMDLYLALQRPSDSHYRAIINYPREAAIIASRGCPYNCTFCFHPTGNTYRQRSLNSVFIEIEMLKEDYNINILSVYDECFAISKSRLTEFCERIKKLKLYWSCQLRVDGIDENDMKMLADSGCYIISFGIESASDVILRNYKKNITVKQINNALEWSKKAGIVVQGNIILGAEEETLDTVEESMKWWAEHKEFNLSVGPVIPYPGTEMYKRAVEKGLIDSKIFLEQGCPDVNCAELDIIESNKIITKYLSQSFSTIYDVCYESNLDNFGRVKLTFKNKCPYCDAVQIRENFSMDAVEEGVKWCNTCKGRYFLRKE